MVVNKQFLKLIRKESMLFKGADCGLRKLAIPSFLRAQKSTGNHYLVASLCGTAIWNNGRQFQVLSLSRKRLFAVSSFHHGHAFFFLQSAISSPEVFQLCLFLKLPINCSITICTKSDFNVFYLSRMHFNL